jgi:hypothetical protein|tara:strand:+ start:150 stop:317 length:168 start_codon:yes stop_codon:yes gene_type:complete
LLWWGVIPPPFLKREKMQVLQEIIEPVKKILKKKEPEFLEEQIRTKPPVEDGEKE